MAYFFKKLFQKGPPAASDPSLKAIQKLNLYKTWVNAKATVSDCRAIYRLNMGLKPFIDHPTYCHEFVFSIEIKNTDSHEMPLNKDEWEALSKVEQLTVPLLHQDKEALLGLVVTTDGFQDLIFYSLNKEGSEAKIAELENTISTHKTQLVINTGEWSHYKKFLNAFEGKPTG